MPAVKLLDRVREQLRLKHYSYRTEETYLHWIRRYIIFHQKRHPNEMGDEEIRAFLIHLAEKDQVAASTQNQAFSALLFLYRHVLKKEVSVDYKSLGAARPKRLPGVLTKEETQKVIDYLSREYQLMAKLLYGSGLRVMECLRLRVKDIDFDYKTITIYDGKGEKDRITVLPESLIPLLKLQLERVTRIYESDKERTAPRRIYALLGVSPQISECAPGMAVAVFIPGSHTFQRAAHRGEISPSHSSEQSSKGSSPGGSPGRREQASQPAYISSLFCYPSPAKRL